MAKKYYIEKSDLDGITANSFKSAKELFSEGDTVYEIEVKNEFEVKTILELTKKLS